MVLSLEKTLVAAGWPKKLPAFGVEKKLPSTFGAPKRLPIGLAAPPKIDVTSGFFSALAEVRTGLGPPPKIEVTSGFFSALSEDTTGFEADPKIEVTSAFLSALAEVGIAAPAKTPPVIGVKSGFAFPNSVLVPAPNKLPPTFAPLKVGYSVTAKNKPGFVSSFFSGSATGTSITGTSFLADSTTSIGASSFFAGD